MECANLNNLKVINTPLQKIEFNRRRYFIFLLFWVLPSDKILNRFGIHQVAKL